MGRGSAGFMPFYHGVVLKLSENLKLTQTNAYATAYISLNYRESI